MGCRTWVLKLGKSVTPLDTVGCLLLWFPWSPKTLEERGRGVLLTFVFPSICHTVGAHYLVPEYAASCLIQQRSLAADILCRNVTMLSWPGERHSVICSRERSSFRVGGRAGCRLRSERAFTSLWTQNTVAANTAKKGSYSHHRERAHLNIPMHAIPVKGAGLQKSAILQVLSLTEGKSELSRSLCFSFTWRKENEDLWICGEHYSSLLTTL